MLLRTPYRLSVCSNRKALLGKMPPPLPPRSPSTSKAKEGKDALPPSVTKSAEAENVKDKIAKTLKGDREDADEEQSPPVEPAVTSTEANFFNIEEFDCEFLSFLSRMLRLKIMLILHALLAVNALFSKEKKKDDAKVYKAVGDFFPAAREGDAATVRSAMLNPEFKDPNEFDFFGMTALMWAAINGHVGVAKVLLADKRVDPNVSVEDSRGAKHTAISRALMFGHKAVVDLLLADERTIRPENLPIDTGVPAKKRFADIPLCEHLGMTPPALRHDFKKPTEKETAASEPSEAIKKSLEKVAAGAKAVRMKKSAEETNPKTSGSPEKQPATKRSAKVQQLKDVLTH